jgi:hypothetical protein
MDSIAAKDGEPQHLLNVWLPILEAISEPAEKSRNGVRIDSCMFLLCV